MRQLCRLVVVTMVLSSNALGQTSGVTVTVGRTQLYLGMSKEVVSRSLSGEFDIQESDDSNWAIVEKGRPMNLIATAEFEKDKLLSVSVLRASRGLKSEVDVFRALYSLIGELERKGNTSCVIGTRDRVTAESDSRTIEVQCGRRILFLTLSRFKGYPEGLDVMEGIR